MEGAFAVDRVLALAEAGADAAFQRPKRGSVGQLGPVASKAGRESALQGAGNPARHGLGAQRIKLVDGELHLLLGDVIGHGQAGGRGLGRRTCRSRRLGRSQFVLSQSVERGYFACQGSQRGHLHIALMRNLRHLLVVFAQRLSILADLVKTLGLEQHARVRTGQSNDGEGSHQRGGHKSIHILERQGNLANLAVFVSGNK